MNTKKISLTTQIKKVIGNRILFCSVIFMLIIIGLTAYDLSISIAQIKSRISDQLKPVEDFVIDQAMIDNLQTVKLKIESFNETNSNFKIEWIKDSGPTYKEITWRFPFSWVYDYRIGNIAGYKLGCFRVRGQFLSDKALFYELIIRFTLLFIFIISILSILYPLAKKIPEQLFISPINRFIDLVSDHSSKNKNLLKGLPVELETLETKILGLLKTATEHERNKADIELGQLSARLAHDIRSPLASMEANLHILMKDIPKEKLKMMSLAIQSVRDISNNLLEQYRTRQDAPQAKSILNERDNTNISRFFLLFSLIDQVISQKRYEWLNKSCKLSFDFSPESKSQWIKATPAEVKRMISNLLNNAIEACDRNVAYININLSVADKFLELKISDNGVGMPENMMESYLNGESSKHAGNGLGLSTAKKYIECIGGQIEITSTLNIGTTVLLKFTHSNPKWCPDQILLSKDDEVVILDDDVAMQSLWMHRLENYPVKTHLFNNYNDAEKWVQSNLDRHDKLILLVDYELSDESRNGLMLLRQYGLGSDSYLITSHAEEFSIQAEVDKLKIKLIPKLLVSDIPIKLL